MFYLRLFKLTLKKYMHTVVYALLGAIVPLILIGTIVFCAVKSFDSNAEIEKGTVAVVTEDINDQYMDFAFEYIENLKSITDAVNFKQMSLEEAEKKLKKNDIIAILYLPEGIVDGILYGENIPATITFSKTNNLSSVLLTEITKAGGRLLSGAQAGTYTTSELFHAFDMSKELSSAFEDVDIMNFTIVLSRESTFITKNTLFNNDNSSRKKDNDIRNSLRNRNKNSESRNVLINYYAASAILVFIMLLGASYTRFFEKEIPAFYSLFKARKKYISAQTFYIYIIYAFNIFIFITAIMLILSNISLFDFNLKLIPVIIISFFISSFTLMLNKISPNTFVYVLLVFLSAVVFPFMSGAILPLAFIPDSIINLATKLPFLAIHNAFSNMLSDNEVNGTAIIVLYNAAFFIIIFIADALKTRGHK